MGVPSPAIPSFTDGTVVHQADLNALASNLTNLYNYNQGGFRTQRDCVIAQTNTVRALNGSGVNALITLDTAVVNTNNMWSSGANTQITIQTAGIYWIFSQARFATIGSPTLSIGCSSSILVNGTSVSSAISTQLLPLMNAGSGSTCQNGVLANLAAGATVYLNVWQNSGSNVNMPTDFGGTYLGAVFLTPSS